MNKSIIHVIESMANEKGLAAETIFFGLEKALSSVMSRNFPGDVDIRTSIDRTSGEMTMRRVWTVTHDTQIENEDAQIGITQARKEYDNLVVGDEIEEVIPFEEAGRIGAYHARQLIARFVREAERAKMAEQYEKMVGEVLTGKVKRVTKDHIIVELHDNTEGAIERQHMIPKEVLRVGDRVRAYLAKVNWEMRGFLLELSRTAPEMLIELFRTEVPEINEGVIQIRGAAREPGHRAKIAVKTIDTRIDPIGACIGIRGTRVLAVSNELCGERVDIILWDDDPAHLAINALSPAEVVSVELDEENRQMNIKVTQETLSQAIGRNGQNIRLASQLVGWRLDVKGEDEEVQDSKQSVISQALSEKLDIDEDIAHILLREGFSHLHSIAQASVSEIAAIDEFDDDIAEALKERAQEAMLQEALAEHASGHISRLNHATPGIVSQLTVLGITESQTIADMDTQELCALISIDEDLAAKLILEAREPWFNDQ